MKTGVLPVQEVARTQLQSLGVKIGLKLYVLVCVCFEISLLAVHLPI